jgi:hypothetical protein
MAETITIDPTTSENTGLDYSALKAEGIAIIQALAGDIWTDYNEHDPGVTTLEQLCYALTELSYRAGFSVRDLLTNKINNEIDPCKQALYVPQEMLPCNPVTINDYRKLIIDRVKGVANVWLTPDDTNPDVRGLYRVALYVPDDEECVCDSNNVATTVSQQVTDVYNRHRDVCEDLVGAFLLAPIPTRVEARVAVTESASPDTTLARIFFQLGLLLAPEIERTSLQKAIYVGATTEMIFNGPLLWNGLIDDEQLRDKPTCIPVTEISNTMLMIEGVINVSDLMVTSPADPTHPQRKTYSGNDSVPVPMNNYLELDTHASGRRDHFSISLFIDGVPTTVNARRVQRELEKLWKHFRRPYKLAPEYAHYFAFPHGTYRNVRQYYSIQNQFPNLYGINQYGVVDNTRSVQPAQAKQLKGYLLVFDQMLANYFAQLAHIKDLYSIDRTLKHTYFYQYLDHSVPDVEPLLKKGGTDNNYHHGLPRIIHSDDNFDERRNRFLDVMLAIYGQTLEQIGISADEGNHNSYYSQRLINAKITWLRHLIAGTRDRGQAFDYLGRASGQNISGMEIKIRIQLDMEVEERAPLSQLCSELGVEIVESNEQASIGKKLDSYSDYLEGQFSSLIGVGAIGSSTFDGEETTHGNTGEIAERGTAQSNSLLHGQRLSEEFLHAAANTSHFRIGSYIDQQKVALVCQSQASDGWHFIESYRDIEQARSAANILAPTLQKLQRNCRQIYLVEHILLRFALYDRGVKNEQMQHEKAQSDDDTISTRGNFDYSFTLSAVVSATREQRGSSAYRQTVCDVIRQNTPTHLLLNVYFVSSHSLCRFERIYWAWRHALKTGDSVQRISTSSRLKNFLQAHHATTPTDETEPQ